MGALLNKEFLAGIGLNLDDATYVALSEHYESTLDTRVIESIVDELDEEKLVAIGELKNGDAVELQQWLATNIPELDEIIEDEVAILLGEIAENSDKL